MSAASRRDRGDWVTLMPGVRISHSWMTRHTPDLLAAWCAADNRRRRRAIAACITQVAAALESEPDDIAAEDQLRQVAARIDVRLVDGPDWPPLLVSLTRAAAAGYDVAARLPALAGVTPLPARHPARELHWRLLDECPAATGGHDGQPPDVGGARPQMSTNALPARHSDGNLVANHFRAKDRP